MNKIDLNDPKLTAYALGELDAQESAAIESQLQDDSSLRAAVDEIRQAASMLSAGFAAEPEVGLTAEQRTAVQQRPAPSAPRLVFPPRIIWVGSGLAAAACLGLGVFIASMDRVSRDADLMARNESGESRLGRSNTEPAPSESTKLGIEVRDLLKESKDERVAGQIGTMQGAFAIEPGGGYGGGGGGERAKASSPSESMQESLKSARIGDAAARASAPPPSPASGIGDSVNKLGETLSNDRAQTRGRIATAAPIASGADAPANRPATAAASERAEHGYAGLSESQSHTPQDEAEDDRSFLLGQNLDGFNNEDYNHIVDNPFVKPVDNPLSTFAIDVDTASYSNVRRFLNQGQLPPKDAVRIEEMVNYFRYAYEPPSGEAPFSASIDVFAAPWNAEHRLLRIGLKGKEVRMDMRPATSLVFLIDVSGSMNQPNKLPLVKHSMRLLVDQLNGDDRLAIVTYAGNAGLVMDSTFCTYEKKPEILKTIDNLSAGGSTNGAGGINVAYDVAQRHFIKGGINRVVLCTDGDFNVGVSSEGELVRLIEEKRASGAYLSVLGFGTGNLKDAKMEQLANKGNGNFAYIDGIDEAKKVLVEQLSGTLVTIAKDVKIQVDFNPAKVGAYRLIGYENRVMAAQDFRDDRKDAGEIGAGHSVTALYEIIPAGGEVALAEAPKSRFIEAGQLVPSDLVGELRLRYKQPDGDTATEIAFPINDAGQPLENAPADFRFASAVAAFGMVLRDSPHKGSATLDQVLQLAMTGAGDDRDGHRSEFISLIHRAKSMAGGR